MTEDVFNIISTFDDGVRLFVKARPGRARYCGLQLVDIGNGKCALEITVAAEPREGKANDAIIKQLALELGVGKTDVTIKTGAMSRNKLIEIAGPPNILCERVKNWLLRLDRKTPRNLSPPSAGAAGKR